MGKAAKLRKRIQNKSQYESQKEQDIGSIIAQINGMKDDKPNNSTNKNNNDVEMNSNNDKNNNNNTGGIGKANLKKGRNYGKKSKKIALLNQEKSSKLMSQKEKSRSALKKALKGI